TSWPGLFKSAGYRTATVSSFADRHGAWFWLNGFGEVIDPGGRGHEIADDVETPALSWLETHGNEENWFLHLNYWDAHVPYRTPESFGNPFDDEPPLDWLDEEEIERQANLPGVRSAQDTIYYRMRNFNGPRQPKAASSLRDAMEFINGYDCGILYADTSIGHIIDKLESLGIFENTVIIISGDHGEGFGELGGWAAHSFAEPNTMRVPLIMHGPGIEAGTVDENLHHSFDIAARTLTMNGIEIPESWHSCPDKNGRSHVVCSLLAQSVQRGVGFKVEDRFYWYIRSWHDGWHNLPEEMLFNISSDPHLRENLAARLPEITAKGQSFLDEWGRTYSTAHGDPLEEVMSNENPGMTCGINREEYMVRLENTGRGNRKGQP
ncbi:MAG: sulfatase-like hydrolase/transferase, partial [Planctomycetes bacterium]|nr:sulfatase-like hydrolase/transferase [Planctomycetota bacterium]